MSAVSEQTLVRSPQREPVHEHFVEFWRAGAITEGRFRCVECGHGLTVSDRLPACPGRLWEHVATSPFGRAGAAALAEDETEADLATTASFVQGAFLALLIGPLLWLVPAAAAFGLYELFR
jgi:hypothetical protein